jgi:hypothetical protein
MADDRIKLADDALARDRYADAERLAAAALAAARRAEDFEGMMRAVEILWQARQHRFEAARRTGRVTVVRDPLPEQLTIEAGCYLVQPPLVGADARRLRLLAAEQSMPVVVMCREPITAMGDCPVVAIAAGATIRTKIDPPEDLEHPDLRWFVDAVQLLGDAAIDAIDPMMEVERRVDAVLARIDAIPEHEGLHRFLVETCREASARPEKALAPARSRRKT